VTTSDSFDLAFENPCDDDTVSTLTLAGQTDPTANRYDGQDFVFNYVAPTATPGLCTAITTCQSTSPSNSVIGCPEIVNGKFTLNYDTSVYEDETLIPGTYTITYQVVVGNS